MKKNVIFHEHNTRSKYDLDTQFCNTTLFQKSVFNMGVKLYKYLPSKFKKLDNLNRFRKEVKSALLANSFYTIEEFLKSKSV
jgi:hypothetical protein